jgi:hypothetical protein
MASCNSHSGQVIDFKSDLEIKHLKGNVKTVLITTYLVNDESVSQLDSTIYHYNDKGMISKKGQFIDRLYIEKYKYDKLNNKITTINGNADLRHEVQIENGKVKQILTYNTVLNTLAVSEEYNYYDDYSEKIVNEYYTGGKYEQTIFKYDNEGRMVEKADNDFITKYEYENEEVITETAYYTLDNAILDTDHFEYSGYDEKGNWTKQTRISDISDNKYIVTRKFIYR